MLKSSKWKWDGHAAKATDNWAIDDPLKLGTIGKKKKRAS